MRLDDEDVAAADGDVVLAIDLAVGELPQVRLPELDAEMPRDVVGQHRVRTARDQFEATPGDQLHARQRYCAAAAPSPDSRRASGGSRSG